MNFPKIKSEKDFEAHFQSDVWLDVAREICRRHQISFSRLKRADSSDHIVFLIDDSQILKIYRPFRNCFERETKALEFIFGKTDFKTPEISKIGQIENLNYVFLTQLPGVPMTRNDWLSISENRQIAFIAKLAKGLKQIHELNADFFECNWAEFVKDRAETFIERQIIRGVNPEIIKELPVFIEENLKLVPVNPPTVFMHSDVHFGNLRIINSNENLEIAGLFDFADSRRGFYEYDFLAVGLLIIQGQAKLQREFFKAYGYTENDLDETMRKRLMMLTMLYETSDLKRYAKRLKPEAVDFSLEKLEREIWSFV